MDFEISVFKLTAFGLAVLGCFSLPTLIGLWIAQSRLHWILQASIIFAIASPLMLIRAFDLMLIVLANGFLVLIGGKLGHWWEQRNSESSGKSCHRPWFQLGLLDGLFAFVLMAVVAAMFAQAQQAPVLNSDASGLSLGILTQFAIGAAAAIWGTSLLVFRVLRFRTFVLWLGLLVASSIAAGWNLFAAEKFCQAWSWMTTNNIFSAFSTPGATRTESVIGWSILFAVHALIVTLVVWLFRDRTRHGSKLKSDRVPDIGVNWTVSIKKAIGSGLLLLLAMSIACVFYTMLPPPAYSPVQKIVAGEPNRFPDLVASGKILSANGLGGWPPVNPGPVLAGKINAQSKLFDDIALWLHAKNCFAIDWGSSRFDLDQPSNDGQGLRDLSRALSTRALQSLSQGRHDDVVADGLLGLKLTEKIAIDGIYISSLFGTACEGVINEAIVPGIKKASDEQLRKAASQIDKTIALFGTADAEMDRLTNADKYFMSNSSNYHWLDKLLFSSLEDSSRDSIEKSVVRRNVKRHLLRTEIAIRLYRSAVGHFPDKLEDLVPNFLNQVPNDGHAKTKTQPFKYTVSTNHESYQLYSVGRNGVDEDGLALEHYVDDDGQSQYPGDIDLMVLYADRLSDNAKRVAEYEAEQAAQAAEQKAWDEMDDEIGDEDGEEPMEDLQYSIIEDFPNQPSDDRE